MSKRGRGGEGGLVCESNPYLATAKYGYNGTGSVCTTMPYLGITMESVTAGIASAKLVFSRLAAEEKQNRCQTQPVSLSATYQVQQHVVLFLVFLFPFLIVRQNQDSVGVNRRQKGSAHRPASPNNASALFSSAAATSGRVVRDPSFQPGPLLLSTNNNNRGPTLRAVLRRPQGTLLWRFPTGYRSCCLYYLLPMFGEPFFFFTMYCIKSFGSRCLFYPEFPCVQIQAQPPSVNPLTCNGRGIGASSQGKVVVMRVGLR